MSTGPGAEDLFDLEGIDVLPAGDESVLHLFADSLAAILVDGGEIAAADPAVQERLCGASGLFQYPGETDGP